VKTTWRIAMLVLVFVLGGCSAEQTWADAALERAKSPDRTNAETIQAAMATQQAALVEMTERYTEAQDARVREAQAAAATVTAVAVLALVAVIVIAGASVVVVMHRPRVIERPQRLLAPPGEVRVTIPRRIGQEVER